MHQEDVMIELLRKGDRDAFHKLVDLHQVKIINLSNIYLNNLEEAKDVAQEVFIEILESLHKFRGDSTLSTWIYRIAINKSINRYKKIKRVSLFSTRVSNVESPKTGDLLNIKSDHGDPDKLFIQNEDRIALTKAFEKLPVQQKSAFALYHYEQMSYKEIAEVLKTTLPAVESLIFRARTNLRKHLSGYLKQ